MNSHSHWGPSDGLLHGPTFEQQLSEAERSEPIRLYNGTGAGTIFDWSHNPSAGHPVGDEVRAAYKELEAEQSFQIASIKEIGQELIDLLNTLPESRELALAKVRVEEAVMWAVKSVSK
jgi:hypothetical protein